MADPNNAGPNKAQTAKGQLYISYFTAVEHGLQNMDLVNPAVVFLSSLTLLLIDQQAESKIILLKYMYVKNEK